MTGADLLIRLYRLDLLAGCEPLWWPRAGTFEVVVGAILTQQTKWEKVEASLENLRTLGLLSLEGIATAPQWTIAQAITPSGFYNMKAKRLVDLCRAVVARYGDFDRFARETNREWLLANKGIGPETADSILCYGCLRDEMVVDAYTARLLAALGIFDADELHYETMKEWIVGGIDDGWTAIEKLYGRHMTHHEVYARFHGKIVEYCKKKSGKNGCAVEELRGEE